MANKIDKLTPEQEADMYKYRTQRWYQLISPEVEQNAVEDRSALRHASEFNALHAAAMALPGIHRLHHLCCADYVRRLASKAGRDAASDPRLAHHLALAEA
jgi:hypothetical protein